MKTLMLVLICILVSAVEIAGAAAAAMILTIFAPSHFGWIFLGWFVGIILLSYHNIDMTKTKIRNG